MTHARPVAPRPERIGGRRIENGIPLHRLRVVPTQSLARALSDDMVTTPGIAVVMFLSLGRRLLLARYELVMGVKSASGDRYKPARPSTTDVPPQIWGQKLRMPQPGCTLVTKSTRLSPICQRPTRRARRVLRPPCSFAPIRCSGDVVTGTSPHAIRSARACPQEG
jgi:hypothetical protein